MLSHFYWQKGSVLNLKGRQLEDPQHTSTGGVHTMLVKSGLHVQNENSLLILN